MIKTFTENDILRYVYNDISVEEKEVFEHSLLFDNELREAYEQTKDLVHSMNNLLMSPSKKVTDKIMDFSKSFKLPA